MSVPLPRIQRIPRFSCALLGSCLVVLRLVGVPASQRKKPAKFFKEFLQ